jgi:hypothetical protein
MQKFSLRQGRLKNVGVIMHKVYTASISLFLFTAFALQAQLAITVSTPQIVGQKAIVLMTMKNAFFEKIESARATIFLFDEHGKMAGQTAQWVIGGGKNKPGLPAGATNVFNVVIAGSKPFASTNLTANVNVSRVILEGGKLADPQKDVKISRSR